MRPLGSTTSLISFNDILEKADISSGHCIADLGCGNAVFFLDQLASKAGQEGKVYGIDIQEEIIDALTRELRHHAIERVVPYLGNLDLERGVDLADNTFDRAFLINTLHQSSDTVSMLAEAKRLLKNKGRLIVIDWLYGKMPLGPHEDRRVSSEQAEETARLNGFKLIESFSPGRYHYGLILEN